MFTGLAEASGSAKGKSATVSKALLARAQARGATNAPLPCRAPGAACPGPPPTKGGRNIQPQGFGLARRRNLSPKFSREVIKGPNLDPFKHAKAVGIDFARFSPHALRATAATNALDRAADLGKVQKWLGHANVSTTRLYNRRRSRPRTTPPSAQRT
jgi:Phage integrase family